jgi:hypothetical protein
LGCVAAIQTGIAGDQRSELKLNRPVENEDAFVIAAAPDKRVVVILLPQNEAVALVSASPDFPYSVMLTKSPTPRYKAVLVFEDRRKDIVADSFGITAASSIEQTDDETHKALVKSAAEARAKGEKLGKELSPWQILRQR